MKLISRANEQKKVKLSCTISKHISILTHIWELFTRKRTLLYHTSLTSPNGSLHLFVNC